MTLSPLTTSPVPAFTGFTQNSEVSGGVIGSFDLLSLFGVIVLVLDADTLTASTGAGQSATRLCCEDAPVIAEHEHVSVGTTDSSVLKVQFQHVSLLDQPYNSHWFSLESTDGLNPSALLVALGGFVALLMKSAAQCASSDFS
jgi:hypothetical protein